MDKKKRYSKEEDKVITACVRKYPNNLSAAFKVAESQLEGRTWQAISIHWYATLSKKTKCYLVSSDKSTAVNRKTTKYVDTDKKYTKLQKLIKILFNI